MAQAGTQVSQKVLMKGTEAVGAAAITAGCRNYFGYPITPQNEIAEYLSVELPKVGGVFLQSESEVTAINMVMGAASVGQRTMTSTSGPGYSLMMEGIGKCNAMRIPAVLVLVTRTGPGGGSLEPAQTDYNSLTKGGGHGGYHMPVFAPWSLQETFDYVQRAFYTSDKYRLMAVVVIDGMLAQMMEPVDPQKLEFPPLPAKDWALTGTEMKRRENSFEGMFRQPENALAYHVNLNKMIEQMRREDMFYEMRDVEDAEVLVIAHGAKARTAWSVVQQLREEGKKVGLFRPITIFPFPYDEVEAAAKGRRLVVVEGNLGMMLEDVKMAVGRHTPISFVGHPAGEIPVTQVFEAIRALLK